MNNFFFFEEIEEKKMFFFFYSWLPLTIKLSFIFYLSFLLLLFIFKCIIILLLFPLPLIFILIKFASLVNLIKNAVWYQGKSPLDPSIPYSNPISEEEQLEIAKNVRRALIQNISPHLQAIVGQKRSIDCVTKLHEFLQYQPLVRSFVFQVLDLLLDRLFPVHE